MSPRGRLRGVVVGAFAVGVLTGWAAANTERDALIARWAAAAPHRPVRLSEPHVSFATPPANLGGLANREFSVAGRYRLAPVPVPAARGATWWMVAWEWFADRWNRLWQAAFGRARLGRSGAIVIGDVLIAAAALLVLFAVFRLLANRSVERRARTGFVESIGPPPDARALYVRACEWARRGEFGSASRLLFAAMISALALRGAVRDERSATVGDFRRTLRQSDAATLASFDAVSRVFVLCAYAERPVEAPQWEQARAAYLSLARQRDS